MNVMVHCESCHTPLRVSSSAQGRRARCPSCGKAFVVPSPDQMIEDQFSSWISQDVDDFFHRRQQENEERLAPRQAAFASRGTTVSAHSPRLAGGSRSAAEERTFAPSTAPADVVVDVHRDTADIGIAPDTDDAPAKPPPDAARHPLNSAVSPTVAPLDMATEVATPGRDMAHHAVDTDGTFPQNLTPTGPHPYLVVEGIDPTGVHFAFDLKWLGHAGFAASMPMQCAFTGETKHENLIARPMIFVDRYQGPRTPTAAHDLAADYQQRVLAEQLPRDMVRQMNRLTIMPVPFDAPLPYYVADRCAHHALHCATERRDDGVTCRVIVPDTGCALAWLRNVNGVCGNEYELLRQQTAVLHGEAWAALSPTCQTRLNVWCRLEPREELRLYLNDSDFGHHDEGLAGLVVTDQRLVFSKYHHRGQVRRDDPQAVVVIFVRDPFADVQARIGGGMVRVATIHRHEVTRLAADLKSVPAMKVDIRGHGA